MLKSISLFLIILVNFALAHTSDHVIYQGTADTSKMMHISPETQNGINFMLPLPKTAPNKPKKVKPRKPETIHIDTHIAALHGRLDTLTKIIHDMTQTKKNPEPSTKLRHKNPQMEHVRIEHPPIKHSKRPQYHLYHHAPMMMHHKKMTSDENTKKTYKRRMLLHKPRHRMPTKYKVKEIHMHKVAKLVRSIRKETCPSNPGGSFEITLGVHPKTGNLAVINSENGFVVNISCKKSRKKLRKCREDLDNSRKNNRLYLTKRSIDHSVTKQNKQPHINKPIKHSKPNSKPKRKLRIKQPHNSEHIENIAEDLNAHESPFNHKKTMTKRILSALATQPHRVIIQRHPEHNGIKLSLPDIINPPKPLTRPIG